MTEATNEFAIAYILDGCDDCPENKDGKCMTQSHCFEVKQLAIKALRQEPCEDAISRQYLLDNCVVDKVTMPYVPVSKIENAPPATPKQKMGHWEYTGTYDEDGMLECSVCKREVDPSCYHYKFCPMCGAKMSENPTGSESEGNT